MDKWWLPKPLWKIWKSVGMVITHEWKDKNAPNNPKNMVFYHMIIVLFHSLWEVLGRSSYEKIHPNYTKLYQLFRVTPRLRTSEINQKRHLTRVSGVPNAWWYTYFHAVRLLATTKAILCKWKVPQNERQKSAILQWPKWSQHTFGWMTSGIWLWHGCNNLMTWCSQPEILSHNFPKLWNSTASIGQYEYTPNWFLQKLVNLGFVCQSIWWVYWVQKTNTTWIWQFLNNQL